MESKAKWIAGVALVGVAAAVGATLWWPTGNADSTYSGPATATGETPPKLQLPAMRAETAPQTAAQRAAGRFSVAYTARLQLAASAGAPREATVQLQAELEVAAVPGDKQAPADTAWLAVRANRADLQASEVARTAAGLGDGTVPPQGLHTPFAVQLDSAGRVQEVRFAAAAAPGVRALWAGLVRDLQFVVPAGAEAKGWQASEENINAAFAAAYVRNPDGSYAKSWRTTAGGHFAGGATGQFRFAKDHLAEANVRLDGVTGAGGEREFGRFQADVQLKWRGPCSGAWAADVKPELLAAFDPAQGMPQMPERPKALVALANFEADIAHAAAVRNLQDRAEARKALARAIRDTPAKATEVAERLRAGGMPEPVERAYIEALVEAGTPAAQASVAQLLHDTAVGDDLALRLLAGSALMRHPTGQFVAAVRGVAEGEGKRPEQTALGAKVTWGALVGFAGQDDPVVGAQFGRELIDAATPRVLAGQPGHGSTAPVAGVVPASAAERAAWLDGLGNAGLPESAPLVLAALADTSDRVRKCAAHALRFLPAAAVKPAMVKAMKTEDSIFVREALLLAARWQGPADMLELARHALRDDVSEHVRLAAAFTIATWAADTPGLYPVLEQALQSEQADNVRESLKSYLKPNRTDAPWLPVGNGSSKAATTAKAGAGGAP